MKHTRKIMSPTSVTFGFVDDGDTIGTPFSWHTGAPTSDKLDATSPSTATTPILVHKPRHGVARFALFALVVVRDDANLFAIDAARLVDLVDRQSECRYRSTGRTSPPSRSSKRSDQARSLIRPTCSLDYRQPFRSTLANTADDEQQEAHRRSERHARSSSASRVWAQRETVP